MTMLHTLEGIDPSFGQGILRHASIGDLYGTSDCFVSIRYIVKTKMLARSFIRDTECIELAIVRLHLCPCPPFITEACPGIDTSRGRRNEGLVVDAARASQETTLWLTNLAIFQLLL